MEQLHENPFDLDQTLALVYHLLNDFSDEIPAEVVRGEQSGKIFKIQTNWFQGVVHLLYIVTEHIESRGDTVPNEISALMAYLTSQNFKGQEKNKPEDVIRANLSLKISLEIINHYKNSI